MRLYGEESCESYGGHTTAGVPSREIFLCKLEGQKEVLVDYKVIPCAILPGERIISRLVACQSSSKHLGRRKRTTVTPGLIKTPATLFPTTLLVMGIS